MLVAPNQDTGSREQGDGSCVSQSPSGRRRPCVEAWQRRVRGPQHRHQLVAPHLRQPELQDRGRRVATETVHASGSDGYRSLSSRSWGNRCRHALNVESAGAKGVGEREPLRGQIGFAFPAHAAQMPLLLRVQREPGGRHLMIHRALERAGSRTALK
jgi:hypothetical protein